MEKIKSVLIGIFIFIAILSIASFIIAFPTMWIWNWIMPEIFGLPKITYSQAVGLQLLSTLLIRSTNSSSNKK